MGMQKQGFSKPLFTGLIIATLLAAGCSSGKSSKDTTPDTFGFTSQTDVDYETLVVSDPITVTGIEAAAPVTITGGEYQIDDGAFTKERGTVKNDQTITVRFTSSQKAETTGATLTVGGVSATFSATTVDDTVEPEVSIQFPPPASMTEGPTIYIRGESADVHGSVDSITVNGNAVTTDDDYATWSVELALDAGDNTFTVTAEDAAGNVSEGETVNVRQAPITNAFPNDDVVFEDPAAADLHMSNGEPTIFVSNYTARAVVAVDLYTGERTVLSDNNGQDEHPFDRPWGVLVDSDSSTVYVSDRSLPAIFQVNLDSGSRTVLIDNTMDNTAMDTPRGMGLFEDNGELRLYVADRWLIYSIDVLTGQQEILSDSRNGIPNMESPIENASDLIVDGSNNRLIVTDNTALKEVVVVDLTTGQRNTLVTRNSGSLAAIAADLRRGRVLLANNFDREIISLNLQNNSQAVFSSDSHPNAVNALAEPWDVVTSPDLNYAIVVDRLLKGVLAVDLETGERVIVSKSSTVVQVE